jgi:hypothetical protein
VARRPRMTQTSCSATWRAAICNADSASAIQPHGIDPEHINFNHTSLKREGFISKGTIKCERNNASAGYFGVCCTCSSMGALDTGYSPTEASNLLDHCQFPAPPRVEVWVRD